MSCDATGQKAVSTVPPTSAKWPCRSADVTTQEIPTKTTNSCHNSTHLLFHLCTSFVASRSSRTSIDRRNNKLYYLNTPMVFCSRRRRAKTQPLLAEPSSSSSLRCCRPPLEVCTRRPTSHVRRCRYSCGSHSHDVPRRSSVPPANSLKDVT